MSTLIDLSKKVQITLEKKGITDTPIVRVGFAIDVSGSMSSLFRNGTVEKVTQRIMALANRFDDNGELDVWTFNQDCEARESATPASFGNYIRNELGSDPAGGGTAYAPVAREIINFYTQGSAAEQPGFFSRMFGAKPAAAPAPALPPAYVIFMTDGENNDDDKRPASRVFDEAKNLPIYWQFVGLGPDHHFEFISNIADKLPTAGFCAFDNIERVGDDEIFRELLNDEFVAWVKQFPAAKRA